MILDQLAQSSHYLALHPGFAAAFEYLKTAPLSDMAAGRHEIDGERMYVVINRLPGRGRDGAKVESHRRYIDIQFTIQGAEEIGWRALADCQQPTEPFDPAKDLGFFQDRPETWLTVPPGSFAIFFPRDGHAPLGGTGDLVKAVMKIAVDW